MDMDGDAPPDGLLSPSVQALADSPLFDPAFYARQAAIEGTPAARAIPTWRRPA